MLFRSIETIFLTLPIIGKRIFSVKTLKGVGAG
jgi:hypothetical protein